MSVEPVVAALAGLVFLGEVLSDLQWIAIGAIITASIGATLTTRTPSAPPVAAD
jgi:inner membrane transporter RhtA